MFHNPLFSHTANTICTNLTIKNRSIKEREQYLSSLLKSPQGKNSIYFAVKSLKKKLQKTDKQSEAMHPLYKRALCDLQCALDSMNPTVRFICDYLTNSERMIEDKDAYLDNLLLTKSGKMIINSTISRISDDIDTVTSLINLPFLNDRADDLEALNAELSSANYTLELLTSAQDRLAPTCISVYQYLQNTERSEEQKNQYLIKLSDPAYGNILQQAISYANKLVAEKYKSMNERKLFPEVGDPDYAQHVLFEFLHPGIRNRVSRPMHGF